MRHGKLNDSKRDYIKHFPNYIFRISTEIVGPCHHFMARSR